MTRQATSTALQKQYDAFAEMIRNFSDEQLTTAPEGKWNALKQLDHLHSSVNAVNLAFKLPAFIVKWKFGKANRPSRTYQEVVDKYNAKLVEATGRNPPKDFMPKDISLADKEKMLGKLAKAVATMKNGFEKMSDKNLDEIILPHPLLGRITLREMTYFTIYHGEFHEKLVKKYVFQ